jgi:serine/threonine protein kinase
MVFPTAVHDVGLLSQETGTCSTPHWPLHCKAFSLPPVVLLLPLKVAHRDIKLENLLLKPMPGLTLPLLKVCCMPSQQCIVWPPALNVLPCSLQMCDFGFSKVFAVGPLESRVGTLACRCPVWSWQALAVHVSLGCRCVCSLADMAPELIKAQPYGGCHAAEGSCNGCHSRCLPMPMPADGRQADVWSCGVVRVSFATQLLRVCLPAAEVAQCPYAVAKALQGAVLLRCLLARACAMHSRTGQQALSLCHPTFGVQVLYVMLVGKYPFGVPDESNARDKKAMMTRVRLQLGPSRAQQHEQGFAQADSGRGQGRPAHKPGCRPTRPTRPPTRPSAIFVIMFAACPLRWPMQNGTYLRTATSALSAWSC